MAILLSILRLLLAFVAVVGANGAHARAAGGIAVAIDLRYDDRTLGTPVLTVAYDRPATMKIDRPGGYAIDLSLHRATIGGAPAAQVALAVAVERAGRWRQVATPTLLIGCSGRGMVEIAGRDGAARPVRLAVAIAPAAIDPACARG